MKFFVSPYHLKSATSPNAQTPATTRSGVLLKVQWPNGKVGYTDLHPWPEMGDQPLNEQLMNLQKLRLTPQTEQAIWCAKRDANARAEKKSLFPTGIQLRNNYLIENVASLGVGELDEIAQRGFTTLKLKCGRDLEEEVKVVNRIAGRGDFRLRLDFNATATPALFEKFISQINKQSLPTIEYVEDPFPYEHESWREARKLVRIAIDFESRKLDWNKTQRPSCDVVILKPVRMDVEKIVEVALHWRLKIAVTSAMDHPVGVMHAICVALELKKKHDPHVLEAGCLTLRHYQMDSFAAAVPVQGPFFMKPMGFGIGFDDLLASQSWTALGVS